MEQVKNLILGAGIAGLGASYALNERGESSVVLEKNPAYGGLCNSFEIQGFRFDRFVHLSFTKDERVNNIFHGSSPEVITHIPNPFNLYHNIWIKHPAQNNLYPLPELEKKLILDGFFSRPLAPQKVNNYEEWLRIQYGDYFAEHFPMVYTRKYWMHEARDLRTEWIGIRLYQPSVEEVIQGCKTPDTPVTYFAKQMRYPEKGGIMAYLKSMAAVADIRCNAEVREIDLVNKLVTTKDGRIFRYDRLISSLPLTEIIPMLRDVPDSVLDATSQLDYTSGYHVSVALKTKNIPPYLWWYIYDEEILAARVYSPSLKSPDNAPEGCSSLQMEVYCKENQYTEQQLIDGTVGKLIERGILNAEDILFTHVGFEKFANIVFTEPIYEARRVVRDYLSSVGIETIGRFGEWDYLWTDQSLLSGLKIR